MVYEVVVLKLCAGVAQLVEHKLPKLGVASSNLVARSRYLVTCRKVVCFFKEFF